VNFGIPRLQAGYNSYTQIVQSPGYVTIMAEMAHDARIIPLDGRPHLAPHLRTWNGDSRGRWDGDTLVVETTNFSPKSEFMGAHENLRLTERLTRADSQTLHYEFTVDDPTAFTRAWTGLLPMTLTTDVFKMRLSRRQSRADGYPSRRPLQKPTGNRRAVRRPCDTVGRCLRSPARSDDVLLSFVTEISGCSSSGNPSTAATGNQRRADAAGSQLTSTGVGVGFSPHASSGRCCCCPHGGALADRSDGTGCSSSRRAWKWRSRSPGRARLHAASAACMAVLLAGVRGVLLSLDNPLRRSFVTEMVPQEDIQRRRALRHVVNLSRIFGPSLAGLWS
jgi:hypothetical protein